MFDPIGKSGISFARFFPTLEKYSFKWLLISDKFSVITRSGVSIELIVVVDFSCTSKYH